MSADHRNTHYQVNAGSKANDSHKHKDKHKEKDHRHKDHKKDKEREKAKHSNSEHREGARDPEKKQRDKEKEKEKEKLKHSNGSSDKHRDKHKEKEKEKEKERRREEKVKSSHTDKPKREIENGYTREKSPPHIKSEPEEDNRFDPSSPKHKPVKRERVEEEFDYKPKKVKEDEKKAKKRRQDYDDDEEEEDIKPKKKTKVKKGTDGKKPKKEEEEKWEEERATDGSKWRFLEHKGPVFALPYEPLPPHIRFFYDGKQMKLNPPAEEVATFFAKMLDHEYTTKDIFRKNFFKDWRKEMTPEEKSKISDLNKCNFNEMSEHFKAQSEAKKQMSKDEKLKIKEENERVLQEYGFCIMDNHKERIGNFRIEPPGLFRGRGDHPKMGMLKRRIRPGDIIINCSKDSKHPKPPAGTRWKELRHDNKVTWLVSWTENIQGSIKYIMLNPSSRIKKEEGETADTVGCCSLRVEHINLYSKADDQEYVVEFDFLGKDSIRYYNKIPVEKRVFKNLQLFLENKQPEDDLFDRLNTSILNKHLQELMDGLTAKVFRTYNASITLQQQLKALTSPEDNLPAKILSYNRANRAVAVLCNHQRAPPKTFEKSMQNLQTKIDDKQKQLSTARKQLKSAKADHKASHDDKSKKTVEVKRKAVQRIEEQLMKLQMQATDREENKQIALGTSKLNYLDPRISVAWCKKWDIPVEKIYNKTQREKFAWAIDMAED
ncbi:hypothetical protein CRUP_020173, partial [Coryphaenoides rupestris]